ncbi:MAG TPA: transcription antitermination factor NusB [Phycisphaerales bacterium]|nr:transcription antitermination factor NusB [Phycisphaerales bacterium]
MATPRDIRRLAFQALYLLDARTDSEPADIRAALAQLGEEDPADLTPRERERAFELAQGAFQARRETDALVRELAPTWPAHRQPAVDRAIIRLAAHEMNTDPSMAKVAVNEAIELAKRYSTERSPAFVNGVLDKVLRRVLNEPETAPGLEPVAPEPAAPAGGEGA